MPQSLLLFISFMVHSQMETFEHVPDDKERRRLNLIRQNLMRLFMIWTRLCSQFIGQLFSLFFSFQAFWDDAGEDFDRRPSKSQWNDGA